jgi:hypothetical protein
MNALGASTARYISKSVISLGSLASDVEPVLPILVQTKPAFESFDSIRLTKLGLVFTLEANCVDVVSDSGKNPSPAII